MSETEQLLPEQSHATADSPGRRLAEARKARGLSLEEVAAQLRLNVSTLQALESDDTSRLPPAAYVSGYLRSYARALGLSEAEILRSNPATPSGEPPLVGVVARSRTDQVNANDPQVRFVSYLVIGGLLLISSAWWLAQQEESLPESVEAPVVQAAPEEAVAPVDPAAVALQPVPGTADAAAQPVAPAATTASPVPPTAARPVTPAVAPAATAPAAVAPVPVVEVPPKPALPPPPPLTPDTPQSKVTLEFSAECWVDVMDAAGRQLAYELALEGRKMTVRGEAPFKVFFGYSPGVQVHFNDQLYDHRPFQRRDMARFKLGTAEDNTLRTDQ